VTLPAACAVEYVAADSATVPGFAVVPPPEPELAALLRDHAPRHSVPGAALGILHEGSVTTACYGVADVTTGAPVTIEPPPPDQVTDETEALTHRRSTPTGG